MKRAAIAVWAVFLLSPLAAVPQTAPAGAGINGIVIAAGTDQPVAGARLTLTQLDAPATAGRPPSGPDELWGITATSGADGRFEFSGLAPGAYKLTVSGNGYVRQEFAREATPIVLNEGQFLANLEVRLIPAGTIAGQVRNAAGRPLAGIPVRAVRRAFTAAGDPTFQTAANAITNDRGEYRLYWLTPGRYYIAAGIGWSILSAGMSEASAFVQDVNRGNNTVRETYLQMFFPGNAGIERATLIDLQPAAELGGIDFTLTSPGQYHIRGSVIAASTGQPPAQAGVGLTRFEEGATSGGTSFVFYDPASGTFDIPGLFPGTYGVSIIEGAGLQASVRMPGTEPRQSASIKVTIAGSDIENLVMTIRRPAPVAGVIRVEGNLDPPPVLEGLRVQLRPADPLNPPVIGGRSRASTPATADGAFVLDEAPDGDFRVTIPGLPANLYIKEARLDGADVLVSAGQFSRGGTLDILVSANGGRIEGVITDERVQPAPAVEVVLIPDREPYQPELFKAAATDASGRFNITGIAPGDYKLFKFFASENLEPYAYFDPEFLQRFEDRALPLHVSEFSIQTMEVQIIPAGDIQ